MPKQVTAGRRAAFLKALAETGSVTLSAQRARVNKDWARWTRKRDAGFDAACGHAIAAAHAALSATRDARGMAPPKGWGTLDGVELAVRGAPGRRVQIRRARVDGWSASVEDRFLRVLAATCNVKAACAEIAMTQASAYYHRRSSAPFARRWAEALEDGYARIEAGLIEHACSMFSHDGVPHDGISHPGVPHAAVIAPIRAGDALRSLRLHGHATRGIGGRPGARGWKPSPDEVTDTILAGLERIARARGVTHATRARDEREWARRRGGSDA